MSAPKLERRFDHVVGTDPDTGERYLFFWKNESPFSQWHPKGFTYAGRHVATAEQWMMGMKAHVFGDVATLRKILSTSDPREQKALGRAVRNFDEDVWRARSFGAVYLGNHFKFSGKLAPRLMETTGFTLVEASPLDRVWGIGLAEDDPSACRRAAWRGENRLGRVLTELREDVSAGRVQARVEEFSRELDLPAFESHLEG